VPDASELRRLGTSPHADPIITHRNGPYGARHPRTALAVCGQEHVLSIGDGLSSHDRHAIPVMADRLLAMVSTPACFAAPAVD
jgi:hypothetical protein